MDREDEDYIAGVHGEGTSRKSLKLDSKKYKETLNPPPKIKIV